MAVMMPISWKVPNIGVSQKRKPDPMRSGALPLFILFGLASFIDLLDGVAQLGGEPVDELVGGHRLRVFFLGETNIQPAGDGVGRVADQFDDEIAVIIQEVGGAQHQFVEVSQKLQDQVRLDLRQVRLDLAQVLLVRLVHFSTSCLEQYV